MDKMNVSLVKENNDFFRSWVQKEWEHHNTVDNIYKLRIVKPEEITFAENEENYKIMLDGIMVGFVAIQTFPKEIYLHRFFIADEFRGIGIGTLALSKVIDMAKAQNKDLSLQVVGDNTARHLYERLGFKTDYRRMVLKITDDIYLN